MHRRPTHDTQPLERPSRHPSAVCVVRTRSVYVIDCASAAIMAPAALLLSQSLCCVCFVTFLRIRHLNFSSTPNLILNLTIS